MRIKKVEQSIGVAGKVLNNESESTKDTYSANYINSKINEISKGSLVMAMTCYITNHPTLNNSNIPFNNMAIYYKSDEFDASLSEGVVTLELPEGDYLAKINSSIWIGKNLWDYSLLSIFKNNKNVARAMAPKPNGEWANVATEVLTLVKNGDKLSSYFNTNGNDYSNENMTSTDTKMDILIYKI